MPSINPFAKRRTTTTTAKATVATANEPVDTNATADNTTTTTAAAGATASPLQSTDDERSPSSGWRPSDDYFTSGKWKAEPKGLPPDIQRKGSAFTLSPSSPTATSPEKKAGGRNLAFNGISRDKDKADKDKRPRASPRKGSSSPFLSKRSNSSRRSSDSHPLNLPPEELRRLSQLSAMSSPRRENGSVDGGSGGSRPMDTTPAPQTPGGAAMETNGVNGAGDVPVTDEEQRAPTPPQHRSPPPEPSRQQEAEGFKQSGNKFYKNKQYAQAIQEYTKAIEADRNSSTYISNRAAAYMAANQFAQALEDCKLADELDPENPKILLRLAKVYTSLGRPREALDIFDRIQPPVSVKDKAPAVAMHNFINQAQSSLEDSRSGSMAIFALDQAQKGLGSSVAPPRRWQLIRGEAYLKMGNVNSLGDAQNVAMSLLRTNNQDPDALVLRGRALYGQGENDKAIQHFRQAIACDPDFRDAVKYLRMVQKLDRMKEEGNGHFKSGRYQQAVDVYTSALEVDPLNKGTNSKILNNRAMCYSRLKQYGLAIKDADRAVQLDPSYTKARKTRAKALGEGGDWEEAVKAYKSIAESHPDEPGIQKEVRNAELELKKSKRKDYYKIMGVEKDAGEGEIKKAYKKLAVKHHPDKNPDDPEAENRFKDISEAYETLIDPQKRQAYDSGADLMEPGEGFGFPGGMGGGMGAGGIDPEILSHLFSGGMGGSPFGGGGGGGRGGPQFHFSSGGHPFGGQRGGGFPF